MKQKYLALKKEEMESLLNYIINKPYIEVKDLIKIFDNLKNVESLVTPKEEEK